MMGDRIRQARFAQGWTQDEVVEGLREAGEKLTKAGLSKYEKNKSQPKPMLLAKLARVLGVKASYFLQEPDVRVQWIAFRKHSTLPQKRQENVKAIAMKAVENHFWLKSKIHPQESAIFPRAIKVRDFGDAEEAAQRLRVAWKLGESPIESLTQTIEDRGGIVVDVPVDSEGFDGLSAWANGKSPVLIVSGNMPADRRRFNLAHELGHLLMDCSELDAKTEEKCAHRFAAALLAPQDVARRELGPRRGTLSFDELALLKQKYGLSMQAWIHRAHDLSIITDACYRECFTEFASRNWRKREPVEYRGNEAPSLLRQMALRAVSEGIITSDKAEEICPGCTREMGQEETVRKMVTAKQLARLSKKERQEVLEAAAALAEKDYRSDPELTAFEAFGEVDFHDETE
jgi:Zn-dependent peptidase ImmA (M78 family)/transcriptional regulator with XRE-family HTH domain